MVAVIATGVLLLQAMALQPQTLPCSDELVFNAPKPPKDIQIQAASGNLKPQSIASGFTVHINTAKDCGKTLQIKAGGSVAEYTIEDAAAAPPAANPDNAALLTSVSKQQSALAGSLQSLKETVLLYGGIAAIAIFAACAFILYLLLTLWRQPRSLSVPAAGGSGMDADTVAGLNRTLTQNFSELKNSVAALKTSLAASRQTALPEKRKAFTRPPQTERTERLMPEPLDTRAIESSVPAASSFNEIYAQLSAGIQDGLPQPVLVNFRNPEALDRNPEQSEPLVRDNSGTLIVIEHESLPKGRSYLAPSAEFGGQFSETHTRRWRSVFDFTTPKALNFVRPAIVRSEGNEWIVEEKGQFS